MNCRPTLVRRSLLALATAAGSVALVVAAQQPPPVTAATTKPAAETKTVTPSGLTIIEQGMDDMAVQRGDSVTCHYTGKLADGTVFDSSLKSGQPLTFDVGVGKVIKGWDEGLIGMKIGQKRRLVIPPTLGYGDAGAPPSIPGGATLTFDVEVLYISRPAAMPK